MSSNFYNLLARTFGFRTNVNLTDVVPTNSRIVEFDLKDLSLTSLLLERGYKKYLGLTKIPEEQLFRNAEVDRNTLQDRIYSYTSKQQISRNSADVLVLPNPSLKQLLLHNNYKHVQYVLCALDNSAHFLNALLAILKNSFYSRHLQVLGISNLKNERFQKQVLILKVLSPKRYSARHYVSPAIGVQGFFERLAEEQVSYAILRWFDCLPHIEPGEDIDMLIADQDVRKFEDVLREEPGLIPCDVYSVSGLKGTSYKNMAYYPPKLAKQILERAILFKDCFRVPCQEDHFLSLSYHAIYHKGKKSGIPKSLQDRQPLTFEPEHDYAGILANLAESLGLSMDITLDGLDQYLASRGWRPPLDTLMRLDSRSIWCQGQVEDYLPPDLKEDIKGLSVFLIREKAVKLGFTDQIINMIRNTGFSILHTETLSPQDIERVSQEVRGGNWDRGPYPTSGGRPEVVVVALDLFPIIPKSDLKKQYPLLNNKRILVKHRIRDKFNNTLPDGERFNLLHSGDNEVEAFTYLQLALPEQVDSIRQKARHLHSLVKTEYPVQKQLGKYKRRSKVELIEYNGGLAVKKTFRPGCERFLEREVLARAMFSGRRKEVPPILEQAPLYFISPYYEDTLKYNPYSRIKRLLPLSITKQLVEFIRFLYEQGYTVLDLQPQNIIFDGKSGTIRLIDFEHLHKYSERPASFEQCFEFAGCPDSFDGDSPHGISVNYETMWEPYVGLTLKSLLYDPTWLQHLKRFSFYIDYLFFELAERVFRKSIKLLSSESSSVKYFIARGLKALAQKA